MDSLRQTFGELVVHTPFRTAALAAAVVVLDVRLPRALRADVGQADDGELEFETATVTGRSGGTRPHRPRRAARAADRGRARLAAGALQRDADPAARRAALARPGGPPAGQRRRDGAVDRRRLRPRGLRLELPRRRRAARRRRLVLAHPPRQGAHRAPGADLGLPAGAATRATGSPTSCAARSRTACSSRATPRGTACRSPPRASAPRIYFGLACGRELRAVHRRRRSPRAGARSLRRVLGLARAQVPLAARRAARGRPDDSQPRADARSCAPSRAGACRHWLFGHYLAIAPPSFVGAGPVAARARAASAPAPRDLASAPAAGCPPRSPARRGWRSPGRARRGARRTSM